MRPAALQAGLATMPCMPATLWTIGHSTRPLDAFMALLAENGIAAIADVRRFPGSRRNPQYGAEALPGSLKRAGVGYRWFPDLGGRRRPRPDSPNSVWRNEAFRGYADYMATAAFHESLDALVAFATFQPTSLMCAEAPWWRCHRAMISDALKARGIRVLHILSGGRVVEHSGTAPARMVDGYVTYAEPGLFSA